MAKRKTPAPEMQEDFQIWLKKLFAGHEWPEAHPEITECDNEIVARMLPEMTPPTIGEENEYSLSESLKDLLDDLLDCLDPIVAKALRQRVGVNLVRSGRPHASIAVGENKKVGIKIDGALMLLYFDLLSHALPLMVVREENDDIHAIVAQPTTETISSVGSLLWAFRDSPHGLDVADMPIIPTHSLIGLREVATYLKLGEQFILGHELWHALEVLSVNPASFSIRNQLNSLIPRLSASTAARWDREFCADIGSVNLLLSADARRKLHGQVIASAMVGISFLGVLEHVYTRPSELPSVIEPNDIYLYATRFPNHPPVEVRRMLLAEKFRYTSEEAGTAELFHVAFVQIMKGLDTASSGRCIARPHGAWCGNSRGNVGWFCADHGWAIE